MRRRGGRLFLLVLGMLAAACATAGERWQAPLGRDHPLAGRIWDVGAGRFIDERTLVARVAAARLVLLGEQHDNADHHRLQARLLRALIAAGRRPAVAFEMLDADDAPALARYLATAPADARDLGAAVEWDRSGWPPFALYQPIADAALAARLPILAGDLAPSTMRALRERGVEALDADLVTRYALDQPSPALREAMGAELAAAHCGHVPGTGLPRMILAQRARDARMAEVLAGGDEGGVLIAGAGHVRVDRGVPAYLARRVPDARVASVAFLEVAEDRTDPGDYAERFVTTRLPFDYVWFTARVDGADPCERFRPRSLR